MAYASVLLPVVVAFLQYDFYRCGESVSCMGLENIDRKTYPRKVSQRLSEILDCFSLA